MTTNTLPKNPVAEQIDADLDRLPALRVGSEVIRPPAHVLFVRLDQVLYARLRGRVRREKIGYSQAARAALTAWLDAADRAEESR